jgi:tRNA-dihydrouridine synthase
MNVPRGPGFQVPFSERIRREADVKTQAVGVILDGRQAEAILREGKADLIAIGRQALYDPYWPHHAAHALGYDSAFENWPIQHGPWLAKRAPLIEKLKFTDNSVKSLTGSGRQLGETRQ